MQGREPNCLTQCCAIKKGCLSGIGAIRLAERSHHRATPGSLSSGCCSVLRPSCLRGTWAHLHWMCSCLWSSSSKANKEKHVLNTEKQNGLYCVTLTHKTRHPARLWCRAISGSHLQFCCHRCST